MDAYKPENFSNDLENVSQELLDIEPTVLPEEGTLSLEILADSEEPQTLEEEFSDYTQQVAEADSQTSDELDSGIQSDTDLDIDIDSEFAAFQSTQLMETSNSDESPTDSELPETELPFDALQTNDTSNLENLIELEETNETATSTDLEADCAFKMMVDLETTPDSDTAGEMELADSEASSELELLASDESSLELDFTSEDENSLELDTDSAIEAILEETESSAIEEEKEIEKSSETEALLDIAPFAEAEEEAIASEEESLFEEVSEDAPHPQNVELLLSVAEINETATSDEFDTDSALEMMVNLEATPESDAVGEMELADSEISPEFDRPTPDENALEIINTLEIEAISEETDSPAIESAELEQSPETEFLSDLAVLTDEEGDTQSAIASEDESLFEEVSEDAPHPQVESWLEVEETDETATPSEFDTDAEIESMVALEATPESDATGEMELDDNEVSSALELSAPDQSALEQGADSEIEAILEKTESSAIEEETEIEPSYETEALINTASSATAEKEAIASEEESLLDQAWEIESSPANDVSSESPNGADDMLELAPSEAFLSERDDELELPPVTDLTLGQSVETSDSKEVESALNVDPNQAEIEIDSELAPEDDLGTDLELAPQETDMTEENSPELDLAPTIASEAEAINETIDPREIEALQSQLETQSELNSKLEAELDRLKAQYEHSQHLAEQKIEPEIYQSSQAEVQALIAQVQDWEQRYDSLSAKLEEQTQLANDHIDPELHASLQQTVEEYNVQLQTLQSEKKALEEAVQSWQGKAESKIDRVEYEAVLEQLQHLKEKNARSLWSRIMDWVKGN